MENEEWELVNDKVTDRQDKLFGKFIEIGHEHKMDELVARLLTE